MGKELDSSSVKLPSVGSTLIDAFKVGGLPLAAMVCGAITIALSQSLKSHIGLCLVIGLVLVLAGIGVSVWTQARQYGPCIGFTQKLCGWWWQRVTPDSGAALSLVRIEPNATTGTVRLRGKVFAADGQHIANWDSVDSCVNPATEMLFYYWSGRGRSISSRPQNGFGELAFDFPVDGKPSARGHYSDMARAHDGQVVVKAIELCPASADEVKVARGDDKAAIESLVRAKIATFA